jgi:catalase
VTRPDLRARVVAYWTAVDQTLGARVSAGLPPLV